MEGAASDANARHDRHCEEAPRIGHGTHVHSISTLMSPPGYAMISIMRCPNYQ